MNAIRARQRRYAVQVRNYDTTESVTLDVDAQTPDDAQKAAIIRVRTERCWKSCVAGIPVVVKGQL